MANKITKGDFNQLWAFLVAHECDIALGVNDFGELRKVFITVVGRKPEKTK